MIGDGAQAWKSCSFTFKNHHYVIGGNDQISKIIGCTLTKVGTLAFNFHSGGCANVADRLVYLCFDWSNTNEHRRCRVSNSPEGNFTLITDSTFDHREVNIASSNCKIHN